MNKFQSYTIGADPEAFVRNRNKMEFVSAHDIFPGTKQNPHEIAGGAVQVDGVAVELNINPSRTADEFLANLFKTMQVTHTILDHRVPGHEILFTPTATFSAEYFNRLPEETRALGCSPDFDAFKDGKVNEPPKTTKPFRTAGGHIHIGWTEDEKLDDKAHLFDCVKACKQVAAALYYPSHLWDDDQQRRELYGNIGAFRPKSYGVEWRALSSAWVPDPELVRWVVESTQFAMELLDMDQSLFEDKQFKDLYGKVPTKKQVRNYLDHLYTYGFDHLPETYTKGI